MADSKYRLLIEIDAKGGASVKVLDNVAKSLGNVEKAAKKTSLGQDILRGAFERMGHKVLELVQQLPRMAVELYKLGATVEVSSKRLEAFAGSAVQAADYLKALQTGSDFTIDRLTALQQASRMLETGMARNTREMELAGAMVAKLGNQTRSTESRMQMLTLLLANQSILRLDEFGLSVENVRRRQQALEKQGRSTEEAFRAAVFAEAEQKLAVLGDTSELTATKIARLEAAWRTLTQTIGETAVISADTGLLATMSDWLNAWSANISLANEAMAKAKELGVAPRHYAQVYIEASQASEVWQQDEDELRKALEATNAALDVRNASLGNYTRAMVDSLSALGVTGQTTQDYAQTLWETHYAADGFTSAVEGTTPSLYEQAQAAYSASNALMDLASSYASYSQQIAYGYADYAGSMADIEAQYQQSVESIQSSGGGGGGGGGAPEREFDRADIERGLNIQQLQLAELQAERAKWDERTVDTEPVFWYELSRQDRKWAMDHGKTLEEMALEREDLTKEATELERATMDDRIEDLKKEIGETAALLEAGHYARHQSMVGAAQRDTSALLAEAKKRRDDQLAELEKTQARQETMNLQSLGRIKLAAFDSWVERNKDTLLATQESTEIVTGMRQDILLEYGLMTQGAIDETNRWETELKALFETLSTGAKGAVTELDKVLQKLNELPDEKIIKIRYELSERPEDIPEMQHGGGVKAGSPYIVGEAGPELFVPGSSGTVINNRRTEQIVGSHNTYNINDTRAMAFLGAQERARARAAFAEASGM